MEFTARLSNFKYPPRKARLLADVVRGLAVENAIHRLAFTPKKAALPLRKLIESAVANAGERQGVDIDRLYVKKVWVDEGRKFRRFRPESRGRAVPRIKRHCHIAVVLAEKQD